MGGDKITMGVKVSGKKLRGFICDTLLKAGARKDVAGYVAAGLIQTSLRGVDSHGVRLLPHYVASMKAGRINPDPKYRFRKTSCSTGTLDADHTFGHAAGMEAVKKAVALARKAGPGHIAVHNSTHFGAAAYYSLEIAKHDMIGLSFTHADSLMKTYAGKRAFLGTNPISFAAPIGGEGPLCLDMATTLYNFNKVKQLRERGLEAPEGVGADGAGADTRDPHKISMLLPIGGYKGYGLSLMVEVLCGILTGMPYGPHISSMFKAPLSQKRFLGHFICAIRIDCFQDKKVFKKRMAALVRDLRREPPMERSGAIQVAGDPEKKTFIRRTKEGIPLSDAEFDAFKGLSAEYGVKLETMPK